jgi:hypothetical protein
MLDCQGLSLNAVFGREVRIKMLKMAVLDRQEGVEKKKPPSTRRTAADGGQWQGYGRPHITTAGRKQLSANSKQCQRRNIL